MYEMIVGLFVGLIFGTAFEKSKVFEPSAIMGQLLFKRFTMLKVFVTALVTSLIILAVLHHGDAFVFKIKSFNMTASLVGGSLLGAGIALSGACPGTVFAQVGVGYKDAIFTFLGASFAASVYIFYNHDVMQWLQEGSVGQVALHDAVDVSRIVLTVILVVVFIVFLWGLEKFRAWKEDVKNLP